MDREVTPWGASAQGWERRWRTGIGRGAKCHWELEEGHESKVTIRFT